MYKELYDWLESEFYRSNIKKYHKYFNEWINNLTGDQIDGLEKQMIGFFSHSKYV